MGSSGRGTGGRTGTRTDRSLGCEPGRRPRAVGQRRGTAAARLNRPARGGHGTGGRRFGLPDRGPGHDSPHLSPGRHGHVRCRRRRGLQRRGRQPLDGRHHWNGLDRRNSRLTGGPHRGRRRDRSGRRRGRSRPKLGRDGRPGRGCRRTRLGRHCGYGRCRHDLRQLNRFHAQGRRRHGRHDLVPALLSELLRQRLARPTLGQPHANSRQVGLLRGGRGGSDDLGYLVDEIVVLQLLGRPDDVAG